MSNSTSDTICGRVNLENALSFLSKWQNHIEASCSGSPSNDHLHAQVVAVQWRRTLGTGLLIIKNSNRTRANKLVDYWPHNGTTFICFFVSGCGAMYTCTPVLETWSTSTNFKLCLFCGCMDVSIPFYFILKTNKLLKQRVNCN